MQERTIRFLHSIGIDDIDDYDLDFEAITKSKYYNNHFVFSVKKKTPWDYKKLDQFLNGLRNITSYNYEFNFVYDVKPDANNIFSLIKEWYFNHEYKELLPEDFSKASLDGNEVTLYANNVYNDLSLKIIPDIESFLSFISYPNKIKIEMNREVEDKMPWEDDASENKEEKVVYTKELIEAENNQINQDAEEETAKIIAKNYQDMLYERSQKDMFKRGGYVFVPIDQIDSNSEAVDFNGYVFEKKDPRVSKKGNTILSIGVADKNSSNGAIYVTLISNPRSMPVESFSSIKVGMNIRIKGKVGLDRFGKNLYVLAHYFYPLPDDPLRDDNAVEKRAELHLHSKMSDMDGVTSISDYCKLAKHMGHKAIALTDHGVVQAYPEAQKAAKDFGIKMLYGCELYLIDDYFKGAINSGNINLNDATYVCFDLESTGLSIKYDKITEFGAVKIRNGLVVDRLDILINPEMDIPEEIQKLTNITNDMVKDKKTIKEVLPEILEFFGDSVIIAHNFEFDYNMIKEAMRVNGFGEFKQPAIDTLALSRFVYPDKQAHRLGALAKRLEVDYDSESAHRADYDAEVLANCWLALRNILAKDFNKVMLKDLEQLPIPQITLKHYRGGYHATVLVKNREGLKDLYKIVSFAHTEHMGAHPFVPRSLLEKYRKNLLVGSACFNGEVFYKAAYRNEEQLSEAVKFYDYIELQPLENYSFLINTHQIKNEEVLKTYIKDIIKASDENQKMIVATGDVHYLNPDDKIVRDVYIQNEAVGGIQHPLMTRERLDDQKHGIFFENPDQHYRSTEEMLDCFKWLGESKAYEYVVVNTNKIADFCEVIEPIPDKLFTPTIDNCENLLRELCYKTAHELYGSIEDSNDEAKVFIKNRLDTELKGIIDNGYSVIYYIAHKLVQKSNDDGYLVGSRGSVGSSFAATMAKITEVNALPPHYRCPHCKKVIFYKGNDIKSGYDLPEMICPDCGTKMVSDGQNIPFQTFLGFQAEKVPDIDLNFPTDYQATAHQYTKVLLGEDKVFRAGTISTVQFKTAYGYVRKYYENLNINPNNVKGSVTAALAHRCESVKRTTGQHPGGIVVIPRDYEVYDFTPVQYPAGDVDASWKTTHFDFHSIHDTILKLDMLGHVDPQALKMMSDLTHIDCRTLPLNDKKVISVFSSDEALGIAHKYMSPDNGALGLPEFGTQFVRQMLRETKPKSFSDLLIISGLSHGTDVWNNNAQELIDKGITDLRGVIGCRDDIMSYLMSCGIEGHESFVIMEKVRKGKKLSVDEVTLMKEHNVPDYYIESCSKIKYLFPKGHACAYVMMAIRVAYYKVYYPLEFYATFFSLRCEQYDIDAMIQGIDAIHARLEEFLSRRRSNNVELALSVKEEEIEKTLQLALEMCERGYKFSNIDIERSDAVNFVVDKENKALIPPFKVLDGLGENGANEIIRARNERPFESQEDLKNRAKITEKNLKKLRELHVLDHLRENDQLSLFDFM